MSEVHPSESPVPLLTPEQFTAEMRRLVALNDEEQGHIQGDTIIVQLLTALGYGEGAAVFDNMDKWYS